MTTIERVAPLRANVELQEFCGTVRQRWMRLRPFDPSVISFARDLGRALRAHPTARQFPEVGALAFWLRQAELQRLQEAYRSLETADSLLAPRGLVFHIPPANIETVFVYSWILCALAGNANIVRLPSRPGVVMGVIQDQLVSLMNSAEYRDLSKTTAFIRYRHEEDVTQSLSLLCDVRVIWGGDNTVRTVRATALPPHAIEFTFPDRFSIALIDARVVLELDEPARRQLASDFFSDAYSFDQMGCSSPRLIIWRGTEQDFRRARDRFYRSLAEECSRRGYSLPLGAYMAKLSYGFAAAAEGRVDEIRSLQNETTVLGLAVNADIDRGSPGGGLFTDARIASLDELDAMVNRKDQTLSHFGITAGELASLVRRLNGRGVDRLVPVGSALQFGRYWDGLDLLQAFSRRVHIQAPVSAPGTGPRK